jgi:large subunit ribosomal protein L20
MHGLKLAEITLDRKVLADLAVNEPAAFGEISAKVKQAIESNVAAAPAA